MSSKYRTRFIDPDNRPSPKTDLFCCRCHKDLKPGAYRVVHLVDNGPFALHPADEAQYATSDHKDYHDLGTFPIGPECVRKVGKEWTHEPREWR